MSIPAPMVPPVTDVHRRAAFEAMHWKDLTFEQAANAQLNPVHARVIESRAKHIRNREFRGLPLNWREPVTPLPARVVGDHTPLYIGTTRLLEARQDRQQPLDIDLS